MGVGGNKNISVTDNDIAFGKGRKHLVKRVIIKRINQAVVLSD